MASQWYFKRNGEQHGPFTSSQLKELPASGQLEPEDLVWREGMAEWLPANKLSGLFPGNIDLNSPTVPKAPVVPSASADMSIPPSIPSKAVPPPVPSRAKAVPPPVPPKATQPPPVPAKSVATASSVDVLKSAGASMKKLTGSAAAKAMEIRAAIPDRIAVGKFAFPKKVAIGSAALLLMAFGTVVLWPKSKEDKFIATKELNGIKEPKSFRQLIAGEWIATVGDGTIQVQGNKVILGGMNLSVTEMLPYQADDANRVITFTVNDSLWTAKLGDDSRLYAQPQGSNQVVTFAREYKGGWHQSGEIDRGNRSPGLERYGQTQDDAGAEPTKKAPWGAGLRKSSATAARRQTDNAPKRQVDMGNLQGTTHINSDGSVEGTVKGDGFSAKSRMSRDGSGEGEYEVNGQKMTVKRAADGSTKVQQR